MRGYRKFAIVAALLVVLVLLGLTHVLDGGQIAQVLTVSIPAYLGANAYVHGKQSGGSDAAQP